MTDTSPAPKWPLTLADPVRAVHYALEWNGDCPYSNPESCPRETEVRDVIDTYRTWLAAQPTADDRTVIDGRPRETCPVAPQTPHRPSDAPEGPAVEDRAADGRTAVRLDQIPDQTLHAAIRTMARTDPGGFRALVARAGWMTENQTPRTRTQPDSRTDSPDNPPDTEADNPTTSTDTVRTTPDNGLREQYAQALAKNDGRSWARLSLTMCESYQQAADAVLAVRDHEMEQLRTELAAAQRELATSETARAYLRANRDRLTTEVEQHITANLEAATRAQQVIDEQRATIARVRRLANDWAILRTHGSAAYELRNALDEPNAGQPGVVHPGTEQQASGAQQVDQSGRPEGVVARMRALAAELENQKTNGRADGYHGGRVDGAYDAAVRIRAALDTLAAEPHPAEAERDQAYAERAALLAWISALHPANAVIAPAEDIDEPGWSLLYLLISGWQMSWHIHPRDALLFAHVEQVEPTDPRAQWDGHSTAEKYERIQEHTRRLSQADTTKEH
ncbi:hypothetical protein [Streptomyces antimycoticus]|uniref:hypothetical protein n=1 Tax=Streptomyces antimycoticus TaxID=68175 RepID=UPI0033C5F2AF